MLHQGFYENWLSQEVVGENIKDVKVYRKA